MSRHRLSIALPLCALLALVACGGEADPTPPQTPQGCPEQATPSEACQAKGSAGLLTVSYVGTPAVPVRGTNSFTFHVTDQQGAGVDGALLQVDLYMPAHGHGSTTTPMVTALGGGKYRADDVVFPMSGAWNVTVHVTRGELHDAALLVAQVP